MKLLSFVAALAGAAVLLAPAGAGQETRKSQERTPASRPANPPRSELKERMKQRDADIDRLRNAEKIGETSTGLVEVVKPAYAQEKVAPADPKSATIAELVDAENKDRRELFELLAKQEKLTAAEIGKQNGIRHLERASDDHWLKLEDGRWVQKKTIRPVKK